MNISRKGALKIHFFFDECVPPILRDRKWFMWMPFKVLFGKKDEYFYRFKDRGLELGEEEFQKIYRETSSVHIQRASDLNAGCIKEIEANIVGSRVLDVGCGRGYLAEVLSKSHEVTACDMIIGEAIPRKNPQIRFQEENIEKLSFADNAFDTVVCAHTVEHVQDFASALHELRRVAKMRLIIVLPKQRPYRYTFDLHLRFFPYAHVVLDYLRPSVSRSNYVLKEIEGDWYYQEDKCLKKEDPVDNKGSRS